MSHFAPFLSAQPLPSPFHGFPPAELKTTLWCAPSSRNTNKSLCVVQFVTAVNSLSVPRTFTTEFEVHQGQTAISTVQSQEILPLFDRLHCTAQMSQQSATTHAHSLPRRYRLTAEIADHLPPSSFFRSADAAEAINSRNVPRRQMHLLSRALPSRRQLKSPSFRPLTSALFGGKRWNLPALAPSNNRRTH